MELNPKEAEFIKFTYNNLNFIKKLFKSQLKPKRYNGMKQIELNTFLIKTNVALLNFETFYIATHGQLLNIPLSILRKVYRKMRKITKDIVSMYVEQLSYAERLANDKHDIDEKCPKELLSCSIVRKAIPIDNDNYSEIACDNNKGRELFDNEGRNLYTNLNFLQYADAISGYLEYHVYNPRYK